jgi:hypothetical protein
MSEVLEASNPMDALPSLPSNVDMGTAGLWSAMVLMQAAKERGWAAADLRKVMIVLLGQFSLNTTTDEQLHVEIQDVIDGMRARRALKS